MTIKALIFDMDGTLVDNMRYHDQAWEQWHHRHGYEFDSASFFERTAGRSNHEIFASFVPDLTPALADALAQSKESIYQELYRPHLKPLTGLLTLLNQARQLGLKMAVGTAAPLTNVAFTLDNLDLHPWFETVVHPGPGVRGKPNPDIFLEAARRMGVAPKDCLVFEDAPLGIEAARRAGMNAVAMTTMLQAKDFESFDNIVATVPDFSHFALKDHLGDS